MDLILRNDIRKTLSEISDVKDTIYNKIFEYFWGNQTPFWANDLAGGGSASYNNNGWIELECDGGGDRAGVVYNVGGVNNGFYDLSLYKKTFFLFGFSLDAAGATWDNTEVFAGLGGGTNRSANNIAGVVMVSDVPNFITDKGGSEELTNISAFFANTITNSWSGTVTIVYDSNTPAYSCYINGVLAATHTTQVPTPANVETMSFKNKQEAGPGGVQRMNIGPILVWHN